MSTFTLIFFFSWSVLVWWKEILALKRGYWCPLKDLCMGEEFDVCVFTDLLLRFSMSLLFNYHKKNFFFSDTATGYHQRLAQLLLMWYCFDSLTMNFYRFCKTCTTSSFLMLETLLLFFFVTWKKKDLFFVVVVCRLFSKRLVLDPTNFFFSPSIRTGYPLIQYIRQFSLFTYFSLLDPKMVFILACT